MRTSESDKFCVILLGMGGPETLDDIPVFLRNIFSDRAIIRLPGGPLLQKPFARLICAMRKKSVRENYRRIGGGSPLLKWTESQAKHIVSALSPDCPSVQCYIGMRYFRPFTQSAVEQAFSDGFRKMVFLPMYPQYCRATTGSSFSVVRELLEQFNDVEAVFIDDFHDNDGYVRLLKKYIDKNIANGERLLFSAHSIPQGFVEDGDPYVRQVERTASLVAGEREYSISYQSRTGPVKWVGPDSIEEVKRLCADEKKSLFIVPISFVCDHIETLFELDLDLEERIGPSVSGKIRRMPMFNDDTEFGAVLADIVSARVMERVT